MTLDVTLKIRQTDLRYQQDSRCDLLVANRGKEPVTTFNPTWNPVRLKLRVIDAGTGVETVYTRPRPSGQLMPLLEPPIPPGETITAHTTLLALPKSLPPGHYEISAIMMFNQESQSAESPPVRVKVRATTPRNLFLQEGEGVWVNTLAEPPEVLLMSFVASADRGPEDLIVVGPAHLRAAPVRSGHAYLNPRRHAWVAWTDESSLKTAHVHEIEGPSAVQSAPIATSHDLIIPPLRIDPASPDDSRQPGHLLLYRPSGWLETIRLGLDKATSLARAPLSGPRPLWIQSFERADDKRTVLLAQAVDEKVRLSEAAWPGSAGPVRSLGEWRGTFRGGGAKVREENTVCGTLFVDPDAGRPWTRLDFTLDTAGAFTSSEAAGPASDPADPFETAHVRVGWQAVAALLRTLKGFWRVYDGVTTKPVPYDLRETPFPLDLAFLDREPVLIAGFKEAGFHMRMADGNPLPKDLRK